MCVCFDIMWLKIGVIECILIVFMLVIKMFVWEVIVIVIFIDFLVFNVVVVWGFDISIGVGIIWYVYLICFVSWWYNLGEFNNKFFLVVLLIVCIIVVFGWCIGVIVCIIDVILCLFDNVIIELGYMYVVIRLVVICVILLVVVLLLDIVIWV